MSTAEIYSATINQIMKHLRERELLHLDIGSGSGDLIKLLKKQLNTKASCCDYTDGLIQLPGQHVDILDLNIKKELSYQDNTFDIVTATEIIEHLLTRQLNRSIICYT